MLMFINIYFITEIVINDFKWASINLKIKPSFIWMHFFFPSV